MTCHADGTKVHALGTAKAVGTPAGGILFPMRLPWATQGCPCHLPAADTQTRNQDGLTDMFASRGTWSAGTTCGAFTCLFLSLLIYLISRRPPFLFSFPFLSFSYPPSCLIPAAILYFIFLFPHTSNLAPFPV